MYEEEEKEKVKKEVRRLFFCLTTTTGKEQCNIIIMCNEKECVRVGNKIIKV